ncbi:MAG: tRNA (adenosine(37)-N6)-threonylcarbamoyltransferase complex dimerization subunit type 1 TsaB [Chitinophagaceae bacterium]
MVKNSALIVNIDTATATASVSLSLDGNLLQERVNPQSIDHAAWIHSAIESMIQGDNHTYQLRDVDAVAVVAGPGSYTGLRVGMATAKGLCYGLNIPLISLNTLRVMAYATNKATPGAQLLCPMLDARRMEVFTALYDTALNELIAPCAMILDEQSFSTWLNKQEIVFFGNGSNKWKTLIQHANAVFSAAFYTAADIACMSNDAFRLQDFCNLAYTEPIYLKDFYTLKKLTP